MRTTRATNPDFLNGVPELLLLALLQRRPMHGYEVIRAIREASAEQLDFGEGCIYPILHRLEREKLLEASHEKVGKRTRIVYRVTTSGNRRLKASSEAWMSVMQTVSAILQGGTRVNPALV